MQVRNVCCLLRSFIGAAKNTGCYWNREGRATLREKTSAAGAGRGACKVATAPLLLLFSARPAGATRAWAPPPACCCRQQTSQQAPQQCPGAQLPPPFVLPNGRIDPLPLRGHRGVRAERVLLGTALQAGVREPHLRGGAVEGWSAAVRAAARPRRRQPEAQEWAPDTCRALKTCPCQPPGGAALAPNHSPQTPRRLREPQRVLFTNTCTSLLHTCMCLAGS